MFENLFNKTGSSGGGAKGLPVGNKPGKGNGKGNGKGPINPPSNTGGNNGFVNPIKSGLPTKSDPLSTQKAQYPGYGFDKNKVNVASNTINSHGTKPGNQVTTAVKAPEAISGGTPGTPWDKKMIGLLNSGVSYEGLAAEGHGYTDALKKRFPGEYKPKTTGAPAKEADVSVPIKLDTAEGSTTGETTVETETTGIDTTTAKNGPMTFGNLSKSAARKLARQEKRAARKASNPINPVSLATSASQSKDFNLKLNNQAVNQA